MPEQSRDAPVGDAPEAGDGSAAEEPSDGWGDDGRPDDHLADVGCAGCVEVWDHLSERRAAERRDGGRGEGAQDRREADADDGHEAGENDGREADADGRREADAKDGRGYSE